MTAGELPDDGVNQPHHQQRELGKCRATCTPGIGVDVHAVEGLEQCHPFDRIAGDCSDRQQPQQDRMTVATADTLDEQQCRGPVREHVAEVEPQRPPCPPSTVGAPDRQDLLNSFGIAGQLKSDDAGATRLAHPALQHQHHRGVGERRHRRPTKSLHPVHGNRAAGPIQPTSAPAVS